MKNAITKELIRLEVEKNDKKAQRCYMLNGFQAMDISKPETLYMKKTIYYGGNL